MRETPPQRARFRLLRSFLAAACLALGAATAAAAPPVADADAAAERRARIERWKGRICTPTGCSGSGASPWGATAGFGAAALAGGWIARRQPRRAD